MMTQEKYASFVSHKSYTFHIKQLFSAEELDDVAVSINDKLAEQRNRMDEETDDPQLRKQKLTSMGNDSLIGQWQEAAIDSKYADTGQYKYAAIDDQWMDDEAAEEEMSDGDEEIEEADEEEMLSKRIVKGDEGKMAFDSNIEEPEKQLIVQTKLNEAQSSRQESGTITYEEFSQLFNFLSNKKLCSIVQITHDFCDVDLKIVQLIKDFNTY